jgi:hypothetical protein
MHLAALAAMIGLLDAFSAPNFYFPEATYFLFLLVLLLFLWLLRVVLFEIANRQFDRSGYWGDTWRPWAVGPASVILTLTLIGLQIPLHVRFAMSRGALTHLAQQAPPNPTAMAKQNWSNEPIVRAGAFKVAVEQVWANGEVDFRVPGTEFFRSYGGFAYCPAGPPLDDPDSFFEPLGGPWYIWHRTW